MEPMLLEFTRGLLTPSRGEAAGRAGLAERGWQGSSTALWIASGAQPLSHRRCPAPPVLLSRLRGCCCGSCGRGAGRFGAGVLLPQERLICRT